jgi:hypothetical protein
MDILFLCAYASVCGIIIYWKIIRPWNAAACSDYPRTHLINLETADMNRDGKPDFVSVRMNVYPPFTREGRIMLWLNHWGQAPPKVRPDVPGIIRVGSDRWCLAW